MNLVTVALVPHTELTKSVSSENIQIRSSRIPDKFVGDFFDSVDFDIFCFFDFSPKVRKYFRQGLPEGASDPSRMDTSDLARGLRTIYDPIGRDTQKPTRCVKHGNTQYAAVRFQGETVISSSVTKEL